MTWIIWGYPHFRKHPSINFRDHSSSDNICQIVPMGAPSFVRDSGTKGPGTTHEAFHGSKPAPNQRPGWGFVFYQWIHEIGQGIYSTIQFLNFGRTSMSLNHTHIYITARWWNPQCLLVESWSWKVQHIGWSNPNGLEMLGGSKNIKSAWCLLK